MKLHSSSIALPALFISVTLFSQQVYTLKQTLAVTKSSNAFLKTTAFNVPVSQSDVITAGKKILQKSSQVLESVKYSYTRGGTAIIDFLDAQRTWFDT